MLERTHQIPIRAVVTAGMCAGLLALMGVVLAFSATKHGAAQTYFDEPGWHQTHLVLSLIRPASLTHDTTLISTCEARDRERLDVAINRLQAKLDVLTREGFLHTAYRIQRSFPHGPDVIGTNCSEWAKRIESVNFRSERSKGQFLQNLQWRERLPGNKASQVLGEGWVDSPRSAWMQRSPWVGWPGCLVMTERFSGRAIPIDLGPTPRVGLCESNSRQAPENSLTLFAPSLLPGIDALSDQLSAWRSPHEDTYEALMGGANMTQREGKELQIGLHARLSLDPRLQTLAQRLAQCFTSGDIQVCEGIDPQEGGRYEQARVRMAAIALVDVNNGHILAVASANSPCHAHDQTRVGERPTNCPEIPLGSALRPMSPQTLVNHALFTQAAPGSLVKPLMLSGIWYQPPSPVDALALQKALARSDSPRFLDAWLCRQHLGRGAFNPECSRPALSQLSAHRLGWNQGCELGLPNAGAHCGEIDLLTGLPVWYRMAQARGEDGRQLSKPVIWPTLAGRFLIEPHPTRSNSYQDLRWPQSMPHAALRQACANSPRGEYVKCGGERMGLISEGYGQGNSRATPVGVANLFAALASSAKGQPPQPAHLLVHLIKANGGVMNVDRVPISESVTGLATSVARPILDAMRGGVAPGGTSHVACTQIFGARMCNADLGIAGKTGTPGDVDDRSLDQLNRDMALREQCLQRKQGRCEQRYPLPRPRYRWYAGVMQNSQGEHDIAFAALVHSNWRVSDGRYADDKNAATEIMMHLINRIRSTR